MSRNRIQMWYKKLYQSNRESKQWTHVMIMLVERYCKTCMFLSLSTSCNDIYMYTQETSLDFSIIDSDLNLFFLTNYLMKMMQTVLQQRFIAWFKSFLQLKCHHLFNDRKHSDVSWWDNIWLCKWCYNLLIKITQWWSS